MLQLPLSYYAYSGLINCVVSFAIAALVFSKRADAFGPRLYAYLSILIGFWSLFYFFWLRITTNEVMADFLMRTCMFFVVLMPPVFLHFTAKLTDTLRHPAIHVTNYVLSFLICTMIYTPVFSPGTSSYLVFPFWLLPGPLFLLHFCQITASVLSGLWLVGWAAHRSTDQRRTQLLWAFWAYLIGWLSGFSNYFVWFRIPIPPVPNIFVSLYVVGTAYAIIRHQLLDIRIILRRSLVYSLLIACMTATYLVMVLIMEKGFEGFFGYRSVIATAIVAFIIALCFNPLRSRLQTFVDRALFKATPVELAEQREQLLAEVRKGDQMKAVGTLAAGLAHEIKNPLASIKTFTNYLEQRHADPAFRAKFQKIVGGEVERINLIVQQLLDFAKPAPPKLRPLDVTRVIDDTLEFLNSELMAQRVTLERNYTAHSTILGDPQQLKQVFLNLILNSLQAMNGQGQVTVCTVIDWNALLVTVRDNGCGIAAKDLSRVFEPFFTTKSTGTGLGLSVVQGIIKEHGGRIAVESQPGQGTSVTLSLPTTATLPS